jgi:hypothetical protein
MATPEHERTDDPTSFEVDRHVDEQPPREDLIDPEDVSIGDGDEAEDLDDEARLGDAERLPDSEDLPESQGEDIVEADRLAEDAAARPRLSDER